MIISRRRRAALVAIAMIAGVAAPALAGNGCREHRPSVAEFRSAIRAVEGLRDRLNRSGAGVVLLARVGGDISRYGLEYTHIGIARKRPDTSDWAVTHQLNPCGTDTSILRVNGLAKFMLDDLYRHDLKVIRLSASLAQAIGSVLDRRLPLRIHDPRYNMISYPGLPATYQNSNQWVLEIIAQAQAHERGRTLYTREQTHRYYLANGYRGTPIRVSAIRRMFARLGARNIRFDDHPRISFATGQFDVVTVQSIENYLKTTQDFEGGYELESAYVRVSPPPGDAPEQEN